MPNTESRKNPHAEAQRLIKADINRAAEGTALTQENVEHTVTHAGLREHAKRAIASGSPAIHHHGVFPHGVHVEKVHFPKEGKFAYSGYSKHPTTGESSHTDVQWGSLARS